MALQVWSVDSCPLLAISDKGVTGSLWEISSFGSPRFFYAGAVLPTAPLAVYYDTIKLTKTTSMSGLAAQNTWLWGDYDSIGRSTIYVNTGESIETTLSKIVYRTQRITVIPSDAVKERICLGARISNNSSTLSSAIKTTLYTSADVYVANVLPTLTLNANEMVDDNSKLAIPINYKVCMEAELTTVSALMSGDEF